MKEWFSVQQVESIDSPALLVYPERVRENIRLAIALSGGPAAIRPHVKTHKMPDVVRLLLDAGVDKFKCATIAEAEMLAATGAVDVLLAYQPTEPKAARLAALCQAFPDTRFSCLIDNQVTASMLSQQFAGAGSGLPPLSVFIDLNVGMDRTGIQPENATDLYRACLDLKGISLIGLHAYDGHVRESNLPSREAHAGKVFAQCQTALNELEKTAGNGIRFGLVMAGTPTFALHAATAKKEGLPVQVSPGTFVFWDDGYTKILQEQPFSYAAVLLTRIVSKIDQEHYCLDLGHKSVGSENPLDRRVRFLNEPYAEVVGQSEEHLVVKLPAGSNHSVGDAWYGIPYHVCPTVALYEEAQVVEQHCHSGTWPIVARNRRIRF